MAKSGPQIKELQRRLVRLSRLDGRIVRGGDGAWLLWPQHVRAPRLLVEALLDGGGLTEARLQSGFSLQQAPRRLERRFLAVAQRDLRTLQSDPDALSHTQAAARRFRGLPSPTPAWLTERQQRIAELGAALHAGTDPRLLVSASAPRWFSAVLALVQALRDPGAALALHALWERSLAAGPTKAARRRFAGLLQRLTGQPDTRREEPSLRAFLEQAANETRGLLGPNAAAEPKRTLGRAQLRRLWRIVHDVIFWPARAEQAHAPRLDSIGLRALGDGRRLLQELAAPLLAALPHKSEPQYQERLARTLAHYGLLFPVDADCPAVTAVDLGWLEQQLDRAVRHLAPCTQSLNLTQALALLRAAGNEPDLAQLAQHLLGGVPAELLTRVCALGYASELCAIKGDAAAAGAYCEWVLRLAPLYAQSGQKLELSASVTARFHALREPNLALLLHCLVSSTAGASRPGEVELRLAVLDAAVGLCDRVPQRAAALASLLTSWPSGAGRARCPEFAAWLDDDALLDRYFHLAALAGEPPELSRTLQRDFARAERQLREHRYLSALSAPTADQLQRLHAVDKLLQSAALPNPGWTRRRLQERITDLLSRALQCQLDIVLRDVLQRGLGVAPPILTPAWRDAVRFYLLTERNSELLGTLLRFAAAHPRSSAARALPANHRWLNRAGRHLDVDAWLAPRHREITLDGQAYRLALEEDPIEVLRMGIPFGTCLSLTDGCNAASAVCNAADANKRVLYLRDQRRVIVGRKLLAISAEWGLLGYELYLSLPVSLRPQLTAVVLELCQELAQAAGIPLVESGAPESLHDGFFWYDDGPQPFAAASPVPADVTAYCRFLGQPVPAQEAPDLAAEAAQWLTRESDAVAPALATLRAGRRALSDIEHGAWLIDRVGLPQAEQLALATQALRPFVLRRLADDGATALLRAAATWADCDAYELRQCLTAVPPSPEYAAALIDASERALRRRQRIDSHDFWHLTFTELEPSLALTPLPQFFVLCDRLQVLWDKALAGDIGCEGCRESAEDSLLQAARLSYCRRPEPLAVLGGLRGRRHGGLSRRIALHLAAAFPLGDKIGLAAGALSDPLWLQLQAPQPGTHKGLHAVQTLGERAPELVAQPDFLAALLRQAPQPLRLTLPQPHCPPFEALREQLFSPALREQIGPVVAPFLSGPADLATYQPGPWELYYHRRHDTPLRQRLARTVAELSASSALPHPAVSLLARLGDVPILTTLAERWSQGARGRSAREALQAAAAVRWQLELDAQPLAAPLRTRPASGRPGADAPPRLSEVPSEVDPELRRRLLHIVSRSLSSGTPPPREDPEYAWALHALGNAPLSRFAIAELIAAMVQARGGKLDPAEQWFVSWFLETRTTWELPEVPPELATQLWQQPELRPMLSKALSKWTQWPLRYRRMQQCAERWGIALTELLPQWLGAAIERDVDTTLDAVGSRAELELLLDLLFAHLQPDKWLLVYKALAGYAEAACFLDRLRRSPPAAPALASLQAQAAELSSHKPDAGARGEWLRGLLAALAPAPP